MKDVVGKVAVVTGGVSGIGLGIAKVFARAGMKVAITYRRDDHRDQAMAYFAAHPDSNVRPVRLDVTDRASVARAAEEIDQLFGKVHVLCNNAGVQYSRPLDEARLEDWQWVLGVNLYGVIHCLEAFLPRIKAHGEGGHVVNVGSMAAFVSGPRAGVYTTSKFALRGLTESLRWDLAPHRIGVTFVAPGLTQSQGYEAPLSRPAHLSYEPAPSANDVQRRAAIFAAGMDPVVVGEKTLRGIRSNAAVVFTHPEHRDELRALYDAEIAAFPDEHADPQRLAIEARRREALAEARRLVDGIEREAPERSR